MTDSEEGGFEFVMQEPQEKFSKEIQTRIRRQAMKAVGASRRRPNLSQSHSPAASSRCPNPAPQMPFSGLELLVKDRGLDPMDLSGLTSVHIGAM